MLFIENDISFFLRLGYITGSSGPSYFISSETLIKFKLIHSVLRNCCY